MRLHNPWKVPTHIPRVLIGNIAETRASISRAALLVKVTARMPCGPICPVWISQAMRVVSTRVLPLPAPARMRADSWGSVTASRCCGLRPPRMLPELMCRARLYRHRERGSAFREKIQHARRQNEVHGLRHCGAGHHDGVGTRDERHGDVVAQPLQLDRVGPREAYDHEALFGPRYAFGGEGI